ncbi:Hypothetical protein Cp3995_1512 [Corynebacterium pseudotuberculosis 3/99-5]|nr:Hypothetical protein Cp3995_1512 [Corynebacterium pseudotuberculosis 3/99-5]
MSTTLQNTMQNIQHFRRNIINFSILWISLPNMPRRAVLATVDVVSEPERARELFLFISYREGPLCLETQNHPEAHSVPSP